MKKKILVIDDEAGFTRLLKVVMKHFEIREENDPAKAIETVKQFKPDLILLDVIMPVVDGPELAARIKADPLLSHIPIVFLTAIFKPGDPQPPDFQFLSKPINPQELERCINKYFPT